MPKAKKILPLALAFLLLCTALAGCSGDSLVTPLEPDPIIPFSAPDYTLAPVHGSLDDDVGSILYSGAHVYFVYRQKLFHSDGTAAELMLENITHIAGANENGLYLIALHDEVAENYEGPTPTDVGIYNPASDAYTNFLRDVQSAAVAGADGQYLFYVQQENAGIARTILLFDLVADTRKVVFNEDAFAAPGGGKWTADGIALYAVDARDVAAYINYPASGQAYGRTLLLSTAGVVVGDSAGIASETVDGLPAMPPAETGAVKTYAAGNFQLSDDTMALTLTNTQTGKAFVLTAEEADAMTRATA